jgi:hypothetical protein
MAGGLYVLVRRNRKKIKLLYWDRDGYTMWVKRLETGAFKIGSDNDYEGITAKTKY